MSAFRLGDQTLLLREVAEDLVALEPVRVGRARAGAGLGTQIQFGRAFVDAVPIRPLLGAALLVVRASDGTFGPRAPTARSSITRLPKGGMVDIQELRTSFPVGLLDRSDATPAALVVLGYRAAAKLVLATARAGWRPTASFLKCPVIHALRKFWMRTFEVLICIAWRRCNSFTRHLALLHAIDDCD